MFVFTSYFTVVISICNIDKIASFCYNVFSIMSEAYFPERNEQDPVVTSEVVKRFFDQNVNNLLAGVAPADDFSSTISSGEFTDEPEGESVLSRFVLYPYSINGEAVIQQSVTTAGTETRLKFENLTYADSRFQVLRVEELELDEAPTGDLHVRYGCNPVIAHGMIRYIPEHIPELRKTLIDSDDKEGKAALREYDRLMQEGGAPILTESRFEDFRYRTGELDIHDREILFGEPIDFDKDFHLFED